MPLSAARALASTRTGRWFYLITALGLLHACNAQASRQPQKQVRPVVYDLRRLFGTPSATDSHPAATNGETAPGNEGFVEPIDFPALMAAQNIGMPSETHGFFRPHGQFPASTAQYHGKMRSVPVMQGAFRMAKEPLPLFGASTNTEAGFRAEDFIKPKRDANQKSFTFFNHAPAVPAVSAVPAKPIQVQDTQPTARKSKPNVEQDLEEDESIENTAGDGEQLFASQEDSEENSQPTGLSAASAKGREENPRAPAPELRFPSYSSYYHATPAALTRPEAEPTGSEDADDAEDADKDDYETRLSSAEDDELNIKDGSSENDDEEAKQPQQQAQSRPPPAKYGGGYTAPEANRKIAPTEKQKATYNEDFDDQSDFSGLKFQSHENNGRPAGLRLPLPELAYIRPVQYGNLEHRRAKPFRPSQPDPLYAKAVASAPSYDFDHSPSAEYREAYLKPQKMNFARSAALAAPVPVETSPKTTPSLKTNCKRVRKQISDDAMPKGRFQREAMTCFVCDDPTLGGTYEQCAYGSEPLTQAYYVGRSQQYRSDKDKPFTYRQRRFLYNPKPSALAATAPVPTGEEGALTRKTRQDPDVFSGFSFGGTFDDKSDYRFGPEFFIKDEEPEKEESSQVKAAEPAKKEKGSENCKKVVKKDMICMVCKNKKSGDNYEQCSYGDQPKQHSYSFGRSASYGSPTKPYTERHRRYIGKGNGASKAPTEKFGSQTEKAGGATPKRKREGRDDEEKPEEDAEEEAPKAVAENGEQSTSGAAAIETVPRKEESELISFDFDQDFLKKPNNDAKVVPADGKEAIQSLGKQTKYDDYFSFLFPDYKKGKHNFKKEDDTEDPFDTEDDDHYPAESKDLNTDFAVPNYFESSEPKKDIEKMLGEFAKKDRSECKKVMKDQMTCFQCVDAKGMQQEECMFVAATEPKSSHLAYHESKEYKKNDQPATKTSAQAKLASDSITSSSGGNSKSSQSTTPKSITRSRGTIKHDSSAVSTTASPPSTATTANAFSRNRDVTLSRHTRGVVPVDEKPKEAPAEKKEEGYEVKEKSSDPEEGEGSAAVSATAAESSSEDEPADFKEPEGPEGLYSDETKPVFDKNFQLSLPKYMLSKSEHEAIFDEVMSSGL